MTYKETLKKIASSGCMFDTCYGNCPSCLATEALMDGPEWEERDYQRLAMRTNSHREVAEKIIPANHYRLLEDTLKILTLAGKLLGRLNKTVFRGHELDESALFQEMVELSATRFTVPPATSAPVVLSRFNLNLLHASCTLAEESLEALELALEQLANPSDTKFLKKAEKELGDVQWGGAAYIDALQILDPEIDLHRVMRRNIEKLEKRFPKNQFAAEDSIARKDVMND